MNSFGRCIAMVLTIVLLFLLPMQYLYNNHYHKEYNYVTQEVIKFVEDVRTRSYISESMYYNFLRDVGQYGSLYDVDVEVSKAMIGSSSLPMEEEHAKDNGHSHTTLRTYNKKLSTSLTNVSTHTHTEVCYNEEELLCNKVVVNLQPQVEEQTVRKGNSINNKAIATYLDGHTETIECNHDYNEDIGVQEVILTYEGLIGISQNESSITTTTKVSTIPKRIPMHLEVEASTEEVFHGEELEYEVLVVYDDDTVVETTDYEISGFTSGAGVKTVTFLYIEDGYEVMQSIVITVKRNTRICTNGHTYELSDYDVDLGCDKCAELVANLSVTPSTLRISRGESLSNKIRVVAAFYDGKTKTVTDWDSDYDSSQVGYQYVTITYKNTTARIRVEVAKEYQCDLCGQVYDSLEDGSDGGCPTCSTQLVSLIVTPNNIAIIKDTPLNLRVIVQYRNGITKETTEYTTNYNSSIIGKQTVTVMYQGLSKDIQVEVYDDLIPCETCGQYYSWKQSTTGCPTCSTTLIGIDAALDGEVTKVSYGNELDVIVVLIYKDGHRELATSSYEIVNYNPFLLGVQRIAITYQGFSKPLEIEVVNIVRKVTCSVGHVYYLNDDGSDPGCVYCMNSRNESNQGKKYVVLYTTSEVINEIETIGKMQLSAGDYISVFVTPREDNKKKGFFYYLFNLSSESQLVVYGGRV